MKRECNHSKAGEARRRLHGLDEWDVIKTFACVSCGAYLTLGPASDTPEVLIEIRAAEIADDWDAFMDLHPRYDALSGFVGLGALTEDGAHLDLTSSSSSSSWTDFDRDAYLVGMLAHEIWSTP